MSIHRSPCRDDPVTIPQEFHFMISLLLSLALAAAGTDAANTQPATETAAKPEKAKPKLICRRLADTGSRLPERECRTQEDWNRQADSISKRLHNEK
jgi:hypothetical protein